MNTIRTTVFLLALFLSGGCASVVPEGSGVDCVGAPITKVKIKYKRHSNISTDDPEVDVRAGEAIDYRVKGKTATFKATGTKGPDSARVDWLNATGIGDPVGEGKSHIVCVPADQKHGIYEYVIEIEGVGKLDPVVRVN